MITVYDDSTELEYIEVFRDDIDMAINDFKIEFNVDDLCNLSQNRWNGLLLFINRKLYKNKSVLKLKSGLADNINNCNAYDMDLINKICDYYISLCYMYDKEISALGFSYLTGIPNETISDWGRDNRKLSRGGYELHKKLSIGREDSLAAKLSTGNKNPVGILAILNHYYAWNMPGVSREPATQSKNITQIAQNMGVNLLDKND